MTDNTPLPGRPTCAPEPDIGDEVRLKSDRDKLYVVIGVISERNSREVGGPGSILVRFRVRSRNGYNANEHEVVLAELADGTVKDAAPGLSIMPDAMQDEDVLDHLTHPSADPNATIDQATIWTKPEDAVLWEKSDPRGETVSRDGRFFVRREGSGFRAYDFERIQQSRAFGTQADAIFWCEEQTKPQLEATDAPVPRTGQDIEH